jgi:Holliday junction resolvase-like predicted endonuclease
MNEHPTISDLKAAIRRLEETQKIYTAQQQEQPKIRFDSRTVPTNKATWVMWFLITFFVSMAAVRR